MSIGWETKKHKKVDRMKVPVKDNPHDFTFWEGAKMPDSPSSSESFIEPKIPHVRTFKVLSLSKTAKYDRVTGENGEILHIFGDWRQGSPRIGNTVSVIPCLCCPSDASDLSEISNEKNYMIVHSKKSLVATNIIESLECVRKAMLMEKTVQFNRAVSKPLIFGVIIHEWIDILVKNRNTSVMAVASELKSIICRYILQLHRVNESAESTFSEIFTYFGALREFIRTLSYERSEESKTVHSQLLQMKGKPDIVLVNSSIRTEIEVKTGKNLYIENIAQVILYGLLQKEQSGYVSQKLFHMKTNALKEVELKHSEVIHILCRRNRMVRETRMPPRKEISHCEICNLNETCKVTAEIEDSLRLSSTEGDAPMKALRNAEFTDLSVFGYIWGQIQEEEDLSQESLILAVVETWDNNHMKIHVKEEFATGLFCNDFLVIYDRDACAFGKGVITAISNGSIEVHLRERLIYKHNGRVFISKDPNLKMFAEYRTSLLHLFSSEKVKSMWMHTPTQGPANIPGEFTGEFLRMNTDQQKAMFSALRNSPYTLIHGMPGTGKTTVISLLIRILASQKKKILVCCHTHNALTNIEKRISSDERVRVYRTGRTKVENFAFKKKAKEEKGEEKEEKEEDLFSGYNVVLSTTRALFSDPIFDGRTFSTYIADEATQQNFLCSVIPCLISESAVLVGDHLQLRPLARTPCLEVSLFDILRAKSPLNPLTMQYRMPACIMELSNAMFYSGEMKCRREEEGSVLFLDASGAGRGRISEVIRALGSDVQILCYFNEQVRRVKSLGRDAETVDRFQGSESAHIFLVLDVFLEGDPHEEILLSRERLNVALTRSRKTLKILGRSKYLMKFDLFSLLLENLKKTVLVV
ncbi:DNA replication ATP-dependent helicase/nuclease Dna2 [Nematocida major]|uniref:DNA replication ATP-dependent helicase/nuclease Dna2 n=1 Tax=Nematocida major TaxID=1912982 RepID=UPI002008C2BD|nr:DNA replication ATP-dependent helicase/nuclease Dna2 [Nematocida major]KAH9385870.1 DNA replication ATP-dependent helicase/nuclease Dna2 [Nematocida major]